MVQKGNERIISMKNILFICSANKDRSATAELVCSEHFPEIQFDSAGTNQKICWQLGTVYVNQELVDWADLILVMERKHQQFIQSNFKLTKGSKLQTLSIKDVYTYMEASLVECIEAKVFPILANYQF